MNPYVSPPDAYEEGFENLFLPPSDYEAFDLSVPDDKIKYLLINEVPKDQEYWNQRPWNLEETDKNNVDYFLGNQLDPRKIVKSDSARYVDNRLFQGTRAIVSYATSRMSVPELTPSKSDDKYVKMARAMEQALYQHSLAEEADEKFRAAALNLIMRKRSFLKIRFDPNAGMKGDVVTEVCNPEDVIVARETGFMQNPLRITHRLRATLDELCAKFPEKKQDIYALFGIKKGVFTQRSKIVTYFETWFTYMDSKWVPREGVAWFIRDPQPLLLGKGPNPNWIYTGKDEKDKEQNVLFSPPKPFVAFNYLNLGHSYIDETCLFDQAKAQQDILNLRGEQFNKNVEYANGRWVADKRAVSENDATQFINKGGKSILLVDGTKTGSLQNSFNVLTPENVSAQIYESMQDARMEIDAMLGTPSVFKGQQPSQQDTLGRDIMIKSQAGMLQDDLVRCINNASEFYYKLKLQMMRVYYTDDYYFQTKGGDGQYTVIRLNGDQIDANVKVAVEIDSTLPIDKEGIRATALNLGKIDPLTMFEDLGLPDPDIRAERLLRSTMDPLTYLASIEEEMDNADAELDLQLILEGKQPEERDAYDEGYLTYFNHFMTTNRFDQLPPDEKKRVFAWLAVVQHLATKQANLQATALNDAGIINRPPMPPMPQRQVRLIGQLDPAESAQMAGLAPPAQSPAPAPAKPSAPLPGQGGITQGMNVK